MTKMVGAMWWIDRWRKSTAFSDMTAEEQGLYRNLCDEVWLRADHVIPDDPHVLARVSGDHKAWKRCGHKVLRWMKRVEAGWTNETALEVIGQSERRAEKQARYRDKARNGPGNAGGNESGNAPGNKTGNYPGSPSPSPSPSPSQRKNGLTDRQAGAREAAGGPPPNPLLGDRAVREAECLTLVRELAALTERDPLEVMGEAADYDGARRRGVNPASLSDSRLAATILDLRANLAAAKAAKAQADKVATMPAAQEPEWQRKERERRERRERILGPRVAGGEGGA